MEWFEAIVADGTRLVRWDEVERVWCREWRSGMWREDSWGWNHTQAIASRSEGVAGDESDPTDYENSVFNLTQ